MRGATPLGALGRGLIAGAAGAGVQTFFFQVTEPVRPSSGKVDFKPPEPEQKGESELETVGRRLVTGLLARGPIRKARRQQVGQLVHFGYGALWGGLYGLTCETFPRVRNHLATSLGYGTFVWILSDSVILPSLRLAAWPHKYPLRTHAYAWMAHVAYAAGLWAAYQALRPRTWADIAGSLRSLRAQRRVSKALPRRVRRFARGTVRAVAPLARWRPDLHGAAEALA